MPGGDGDLIPAIHPIGQIPLATTEAPHSLVNANDIARSGAEMGRGLKEAGAGLMDLATPIAEAQAASDLQNQKVVTGPDGKPQLINPARSLIFGKAGEAYGDTIVKGTVAQVGNAVDGALADIHAKHQYDPEGERTAGQAYLAGLKGVTGNPVADEAIQQRGQQKLTEHNDYNLEATARQRLARDVDALKATKDQSIENMATIAQGGVGLDTPGPAGDKLRAEFGKYGAAQDGLSNAPGYKYPKELRDLDDTHLKNRIVAEASMGQIDKYMTGEIPGGLPAAKGVVAKIEQMQGIDRVEKRILLQDANSRISSNFGDLEARKQENRQANQLWEEGMTKGGLGRDALPLIAGAIQRTKDMGDVEEAKRLQHLYDGWRASAPAESLPEPQRQKLLYGPPQQQDAGPNLDTPTKALNLTPQEQHLYQHHLDNLTGPGGITNANGSRETVKQTTIEVEGKTYNIPTVWDGKELPAKEALARAKAEGLEKFPSYKDEATAEARYGQMHKFMDKDVQSTNAGHAPDGTPATKAGFTGGGGSFMDSMAKIESSNQDIFSGTDKDYPGQPGSRSQGYWQIDTPTWQQFATRAGVDVSKYPSAKGTPRDVQQKVAEVIPLARFGNRTQRMIQEQYGALDKTQTLGALAAGRGGGGSAEAAPSRWTYKVSAADVAKNPDLASDYLKQTLLAPENRYESAKTIVDTIERGAEHGWTDVPNDAKTQVRQYLEAHPDDVKAKELGSRFDASMATIQSSGGGIPAGEKSAAISQGAATSPDIFARDAFARWGDLEKKRSENIDKTPYDYFANPGSRVLARPVTPIDPQQPGSLAQGVMDRAQAGQIISQKMGIPAPPIFAQAQDKAALGSILQGPGGAQAVQQLAQLKPEVLSSLTDEAVFRDNLTAMSHSTDPAKLNAAYSLMDKMQNTNKLEFDAKFKDGIQNLNDWQKIISTLPPDQIAKRMQQYNDPNERQAFDKAAKIADKALESVSADSIVSKFSIGGFWSTHNATAQDPQGDPGRVDAKMAMKADYDEAYRNAFAENSNASVADDTAMKKISAKWGTSEINGNRVMPYPPEQAYKNKDGSPMMVNGSMDWMRKQLDEDVLKAVGDLGGNEPGHSRAIWQGSLTEAQQENLQKASAPRALVSDATTAADVASGKPASYKVVIQDKDGRFQLLSDAASGKDLRVRFDPSMGRADTIEKAETQRAAAQHAAATVDTEGHGTGPEPVNANLR